MAARGTFGNHKLPGFLGNFFSLKMKNVANTNVIYWGGKLLALWEGGLPYKLDPKTLHTDKEEYTLNGLLKKGDALTSHPRVDSKKERLVAFSSKQESLKEATIRIFEFDNNLALLAERSFSIEGVFVYIFLVLFYLVNSRLVLYCLVLSLYLSLCSFLSIFLFLSSYFYCRYFLILILLR